MIQEIFFRDCGVELLEKFGVGHGFLRARWVMLARPKFLVAHCNKE
jgi:hypothetical protein